MGFIPPTGNKSVSFNTSTEDAYEFRVVKTSGTGTVEISGSATTYDGFDTITGKTSSRYQRSYNVDLPGTGPWDIRLRRLTDDSTSQALQNKTFWDSFTEFTDEKFSYPNSALIALSVDSELYSKVPSRGL